MSEKENYQKHIEQALQNVLKKVKNPDFDDSRSKRTAPEHTQPTKQKSPLVAELARARPVVLKSKTPTSNPLSPARKIAARPHQQSTVTDAETPSVQAPSAPVTSEHSQLPVSSAEDKSSNHLQDATSSTLIDGEDLYVHQPLEFPEQEQIPEIEDDPYEAPYNLFEEFVETELDILLSRYVDLCHCSQCRSDIVALALQQLPAYYVTGTRGTLTAKSVIWTRYMQEVMDAVNKAIHIVYKRPRSSCKKIKHMLWVKPELEEVSGETGPAPQFADTIFTEGTPDLDLSDEINEIIQTLEQASAEDKAELLPVFSEHVHAQTVQHAYQNREEPGDMQLLETEDWE